MEDPTSLSVIGRTGVTVKPGTEHLDHPSGLLATLDGQTFDQFFRAHYETIRRRAYAAGLDLELAEDVTQEAMIIAARFWERISVMEHPVAYVATVAINILRRVRRKEASLRTTLDGAHADQQQEATTPGPENSIVNRLDLEHALRFIPAEQAECFVLHHMFGYLYREIARALGIPEEQLSPECTQPARASARCSATTRWEASSEQRSQASTKGADRESNRGRTYCPARRASHASGRPAPHPRRG